MFEKQHLVVIVSIVAVACGRSADAQRADDRATAEAEANARAVSTTTITSAEMDSAPIAADSGVSAFRAEQDDYRVRLRDAIDTLEHVGHRSARRDLLKHDVELLDRSTEATWATSRAKVERDLRAASAPQSQPR